MGNDIELLDAMVRFEQALVMHSSDDEVIEVIHLAAQLLEALTQRKLPKAKHKQEAQPIDHERFDLAQIFERAMAFEDKLATPHIARQAPRLRLVR